MIADAPFDIATGNWQPKRGQAKLIQTIGKLICGAFAAVSIMTTLGTIATLILKAIAFKKSRSLGVYLKLTGSCYLPASSLA